MKHKLRTIGLLIIATVLLIAIAFAGAGAAAEVDVQTFDDLVKELNAGNDAKITKTIEITKDTTLDLKGHVVTSDTTRMFLVKSGATFTMNDSIGGGRLEAPLLGNGDGEKNRGGCVRVEGGSTFIMEGGTISDLKEPIACADCSPIDIGNNGKFTMAGGAITHFDKARAVYLHDGATFNMENGTISHCSCLYGSSRKGLSDGGAIYSDHATITLGPGAVISDCHSENEGGAIWMNGGTCTINGATITRCNAEDCGGAFYLNSDRENPDIVKLTMNNGTISDCRAEHYYGGAIDLIYARFIMNDGLIENCVADNYGGAIYLDSIKDNEPRWSEFIMNGGTIKDCRLKDTYGVQDEGGGVYLQGQHCRFTMNGGLITGCYAEDYGGGVYVDDDGAIFTMNGGVVTNCRINDDKGGGVYVDDGVLFGEVGHAYIHNDSIIYHNYKGSEENNLDLEDNGLLEATNFYGLVGISTQTKKDRFFGRGTCAEFFINDKTGEKGIPTSNNDGNLPDMFWGTPIPEFKDINVDTVGLVKATVPITDAGTNISVRNAIRVIQPIVVDGGTAEKPVTIAIGDVNENPVTLYGSLNAPVITVNEGRHLVLTNQYKGGSIVSTGKTANGGGVLLKKGGGLTLDKGITIRNSTAENGGGIYADEGTTLTLNDFIIDGCTATGNGGGVYSKGSAVTMVGGEIRNSMAAKGSGMYVAAETAFKTGGSPQITNNRNSLNQKDNLYLESDHQFTLMTPLSGQINISYAGAVPTKSRTFGQVTKAATYGYDNIYADNENLAGNISGAILFWDTIPTKVKVTFNATPVDVEPQNKTVILGQAYGDLPTPIYDRYVFSGWFNNPGCTGDEVTKDTVVTNKNEHVLYTKWRGPVLTITFYPMGGTVSPKHKQVLLNEPYGPLPTPVWDGHMFSGWYRDEGCTKFPVNETTIVASYGNHILYAKWEESVTVTFDPEGGTVSPATKEVIPGGVYGDLPTPLRPLYSFQGWFNTSACTGERITPETEVTTHTPHTLHAKWVGPIVISNTNINFGTVFEGDSITPMKESIYTTLEGNVTLHFPSSLNFTFTNETGILQGDVIIPRDEIYNFMIEPISTARGFYSAEIPIVYTNEGETYSLGNLSVTCSILDSSLKGDPKVAAPVLPVVYNLIGGDKEESYAVIGVEGENNIRISGNEADISVKTLPADDKTVIHLTDVKTFPEQKNAVILKNTSKITASYPAKSVVNKDNQFAGTYDVSLDLADVSTNLPTLTGDFDETVVRNITLQGYTPVVMVSTVNENEALATINPLIKEHGVHVTFTVSKWQLPESSIWLKEVAVFHANSSGDVVMIEPESISEKGDEYVIAANGSSFSHYVLGFNASSEYHWITPLETDNGTILTYLYAAPGDEQQVLPIPEDGYEYRGMIVLNATSAIEWTSGKTFSMPKEDIYLYGIFAQKEDPVDPPYVPSSSGGKQSGQTVILQENTTLTPTVNPTTTPSATPGVPTIAPSTQPTQTQKSPAPFAGIIIGLGAALVLTRLRK